jgi:hypothetical protein
MGAEVLAAQPLGAIVMVAGGRRLDRFSSSRNGHKNSAIAANYRGKEAN